MACERRRHTALIGKPVAIPQYNRGGFVAVSYEAKAQGIRKGDGIGERGQKELDFFKNRPEGHDRGKIVLHFCVVAGWI